MIIAAPGDVPAQSCPQYKCKNASSNLGDGICISTYTQNRTDSTGANFTTTVSEIDTSICPKGVSTCPYTQIAGSHSCTANTYGQDVDGEKCSENIKCFSGNCNGGICKGIDNGAACDSTDQCKVGYYCTGTNRTQPNSTCQAQVNTGGACTSKYDCGNNNDCVDSKCVLLYSLPDGTAFTQGMELHLCQSGYVYKNVCSQYRYLSAKGDYLTNGTDLKCRYNATATNETVEHPIGMCGSDGSFNKYCYHPGTDSDVYQDMIMKYKSYFNGAALSKHSIRRIFVLPDDVTIASAKVSNWPLLNNADKCTISLFTGTSNAAFAKVSALVFGVLFLLF